MRKCITLAMSLLVVATMWVTPCSGISYTFHIAHPGVPVKRRATWPQGLVEFLNLPSRTNGRQPTFSECSNDVECYDFQVANLAELQLVIDRFAEIESDNLKVVLAVPADDEKPTRLEATLSLGDQGRIDQWFKQLTSDKDGRKVFGVHRFDRPPQAMPPTLRIAVPAASDADKLDIPQTITVSRRAARKRTGPRQHPIF